MIRELDRNEISALQEELKIKDIVNRAEKLPPFPDVIWKVMSLLRKTAPIHEIEAAIQYDQALASKVIAMSQSVYYSRRRKVHSLHDAILVLGSRQLVEVILTGSAARYFHRGTARSDAAESALWQHAVATALMGEMLAQQFTPRKALSIYTASLLHDIGKTILNAYAGVYLHSNGIEATAHGMQLLRAEREALGIDHQELGQIIARRWRFPDEIVAGIAWHHFPQQASLFPEIVSIVYAANRLAAAVETVPLRPGSDGLNPARDPVFQSLGINARTVEELQVRLRSAVDAVKEFLVTEG